jgi:hypothetical protein
MPIKPKKNRGAGLIYRTAGRAVDPPKCIPIAVYTEKYFVSVDQVKRRLSKKLLCAVSFKGHLFIEDVPPPDL